MASFYDRRPSLRPAAPVLLPEEPKLRILLQVEVSFLSWKYLLSVPPPSHKFGTLDLFPFWLTMRDTIGWQRLAMWRKKKPGSFVLNATFMLFSSIKRTFIKVKRHQTRSSAMQEMSGLRDKSCNNSVSHVCRVCCDRFPHFILFT